MLRLVISGRSGMCQFKFGHKNVNKDYFVVSVCYLPNKGQYNLNFFIVLLLHIVFKSVFKM